MWELDHKEGWALKKWCFWNVVLEKTFESHLDYKELKPVNAKGNQPWTFIGKTHAEAETPIFWPPDIERVTGRKAKGLQTEEIGCKCHFLSLLSGRRKQTGDIYFPLYTNIKGGFS